MRSRCGEGQTRRGGAVGSDPALVAKLSRDRVQARLMAVSMPISSLLLLLQVVVRVRPALPRELNGFRPFQNAVLVGPGEAAQVVTLSENLAALSNNGVENGIVSLEGLLLQQTAKAGQRPSFEPAIPGSWYMRRTCRQVPEGHEARSPTPTAPCACCSAPSVQVYNSYRFGFDRVYGPDSTQEEVYVQSARSAVHNVLQVCPVGSK